ncbi:MAG: UDP-N-acetylglucosamine 2-epimerase [candidate division WOR-3 bacterium]|nr:UDP-N-acetylglucosamine 2-epimerase [candidate division WOR-3 bacterium]MCX7948033.1 UDP-N-acetylglucosamine 2-epimerase [candidate division WOR-3 bacterium]MDW8151070.1 UDP-N-acetylglucosamine 2-epimerase [candidate division WOR-3 bacterium]
MIILIGTKGQLIKTAGVMIELQRRNIDYLYVQTNQHPSLNRILERKFNIKAPDIELNRSKKDLSKIYEIPLFLLKIFFNSLKHYKELKKHKILITQGDTISTLFAVFIGKLFGLKVAHIESGLRSFNLLHPFPEEIIRIISMHFSNFLFAPSDWAYGNLKKYQNKKIIINTKQNTVYDVLCEFVKPKEDDPRNSNYIVCAIHRQETIYNKERFKKAVEVIIKASNLKKVKYILHKPSERQLKAYGLFEILKQNKNIEMMGYLDYISFMELVRDSSFVISDGGGLQEETYYLNVPCLLLRNKTEREVGLNETAMLSEFDDKKIDYFFENYYNFRRRKEFTRYYPSKIIIDELLNISK